MPQGPPLGHIELLANALKSGDASQIAAALSVVVRAQGLVRIAEEAGISRMSLYKNVENKSGLRLSTLLRVLNALGYRLTVERLPNG